MSRGVYTVAFDQQTIAAASGDYDFFELNASTTKGIEVVAFTIGNKSELGDAQEEGIAISLVRGNTTTGNGTSTTPRPTDSSDSAATFTAKVVSSTPASAGTAVSPYIDVFNVRAGSQFIFPPEMRISTTGTALLCLRLLTALADDATLSGTVWVREL